VRAWNRSGFNPTTGAHTWWHVTSWETHEYRRTRLLDLDPFPKLGSLFRYGSRSVRSPMPRDDAHTALKAPVEVRDPPGRPPPITIESESSCP